MDSQGHTETQTCFGMVVVKFLESTDKSMGRRGLPGSVIANNLPAPHTRKQTTLLLWQ